jgi:hypothetical protein
MLARPLSEVKAISRGRPGRSKLDGEHLQPALEQPGRLAETGWSRHWHAAFMASCPLCGVGRPERFLMSHHIVCHCISPVSPSAL